MTVIQTTYYAIKKVLGQKKYFIIFAFTAVIFFALFIFIPLITIPGNDLMFQLGIFRTNDYLLMVFLSMLVGLSVAFQAYIFRQKSAQSEAPKSVAQGAIAGASGIFGAIVGTAACASCLAALFGLIGFGIGGVFFVLKNQAYFLAGAVVVMLISIYYGSRKISRSCNLC